MSNTGPSPRSHARSNRGGTPAPEQHHGDDPVFLLWPRFDIRLTSEPKARDTGRDESGPFDYDMEFSVRNSRNEHFPEAYLGVGLITKAEGALNLSYSRSLEDGRVFLGFPIGLMEVFGRPRSQETDVLEFKPRKRVRLLFTAHHTEFKGGPGYLDIAVSVPNRGTRSRRFHLRKGGRNIHPVGKWRPWHSWRRRRWGKRESPAAGLHD